MKAIRYLLPLLMALCCSACQAVPQPSPPVDQPQPDAPAAASAAWQSQTEPVTLTLSTGSPQQGNDHPWGSDGISQAITQLTGVTLACQSQPQLEVLLSSGELGDLVYAYYDEINLRKLENADVSLALDELSAQHCPDFWAGLDPLEKLNNQCADGHVYTLRRGYLSQAVYEDDRIPGSVPRVLSLRSDWLEALGRSMPASLEEFEEILYLAKDRAQELGIVQPLRLLHIAASPVAEWMGAPREPRWDESAEKVRTPFTDEAWLDYLRLMGKWYRDGVLVLPDAALPWRLSQLYDNIEYNTGSEQVVMPGYNALLDYIQKTTAGAFATGADYTLIGDMPVMLRPLYGLRAGTPEEPFAHALIPAPLTYQGEVQLQAMDIAIGANGPSDQVGGLFIARTCAHPDRAILFLQFLKSPEGARLTSWGVEGEHYTLNEEGLPVYQPEYRDPEKSSGANPRTQAGIGVWNFLDRGEVEGLMAASVTASSDSADQAALNAMRLEAGLAYKESLRENRCPPLHFALPDAWSNQTAYNQYLAMEDLFFTAIQEMVKSPSDEALTDQWRQLQQQLSTQGLDALESEMTTRFLEALARYQAAGYATQITPPKG